eukprot:SAG22_NODE_3633_length_1603_cov_2.744681_1_plen_341_part_00
MGDRFLVGVAGLYVIAFFSYWLQYPGLFSQDGIQPLQPYLERVQGNIAAKLGEPPPDLSTLGGAGAFYSQHPTVLHFAPALGLPLDVLGEGTAAAGVLLALCGLTGLSRSAVVYGGLYLLYLSLYLLGQSMLSFQWDIFLLETGFAATLYAACPAGAAGKAPANWVLRFQLFKIMFMSGIVKTQANCPTWKGLTALEYHFASQCIPTQEAWCVCRLSSVVCRSSVFPSTRTCPGLQPWTPPPSPYILPPTSVLTCRPAGTKQRRYAHQLPPFLLRVGVAATFVTQVPGPFLLLAPSCWCRRLGVLLQLPLQLFIMLTGNYNWCVVPVRQRPFLLLAIQLL